MCKVFERSHRYETALRQALTDQSRLSAGDSCLFLIVSNSPQTHCLKLFQLRCPLWVGAGPPSEFKEEIPISMLSNAKGPDS